MGAISIGLSRGSNTVQLDRSSLQNVKSSLVCFLPHCYGLPTYPSRHYAIICCGCHIRREQGIGVRRRNLKLSIFLWINYPVLRSQHLKANLRRSTVGPYVTAMVSLATTLIFAPSRLPGATTVNANSASQSDVAAAIASAADGDIITIPGGTASWTRTLRVKKGITIQGAGVGSTIIKDAVQSAAGPLLDCTLAAGNLTRITGIEFQDGGRTTNNLYGILKFTGSNTDGSRLRMDHCQFDDLNGMIVVETVIGVIDHNTIIQATKNGDSIIVHDTFWNGGTFGDKSWLDDTHFGTDRFLFIEDNVFKNNGDGNPGICDAYGGARFVVRHNQIFDRTVETHGTESNQRARGVRAVEVYSNTYSGSDRNRFVGKMRSGVILFHDNTITGYWTGLTEFTLQAYRADDVFAPWGGADGTSQWDVNSGPFYSGTATAVGSFTVSVAGTPWTTNQWAGYTIRRDAGTATPGFAQIQSNTSNTITFAGGVFHNLVFTVGDTFKIYKVLQALDQPGRAKGSLIRGDPPVKPAGWNDQATEPCYAWNNVSGGTQQVGFGRGDLIIRPGEHYFNNTPMPGYTPYIYPHPLVNSGALPLLPSPAATPAATRTSERKPWGKMREKTKELKRKPVKKPKQNPANENTESQEKLGN